MKVSICINVDTRPENPVAEKMFNGTVNEDYLTDGVFNKIKFFDGFEKEVIVFVDEHLPLSQKAHDYLLSMADTLVIRQHTNEPSFNDWNYIRCLQLASGDVVAHFDQDTAAFTSSKQKVDDLIGLLDNYAYVSYPSYWSPNAVDDPSFNYKWVSTRFFMCKRETLNFPETIKCLTDYDYFVGKYMPSRVCPWTEHFLGLIAGSNVIYPPLDVDNITIFSFDKYEKGTLQRMNNQSYDEVKQFIISRGGLHYPCDLTC